MVEDEDLEDLVDEDEDDGAALFASCFLLAFLPEELCRDSSPDLDDEDDDDDILSLRASANEGTAGLVEEEEDVVVVVAGDDDSVLPDGVVVSF